MVTADKKTYVTRKQLAHDLRNLGLTKGQTVMLHASVRSLGWVVGGPDQVIHALLDVLGPAGTLMMYVGWEEAPYYLDKWPPERKKLYLDECPPFDPATSRAVRKWSILTEYIRTWPGAYRSVHPTASCVALGKLASWITRDHPLQYGYGPGSPFGKLYDIAGKVLLLGSDLAHVTMIHYAEHVADILGKRVVRYQMPLIIDGQRQWVPLEEYDTGEGIKHWPHEEDYFEVIMKELIKGGGAQTGLVGSAVSHLLEVRSVVDFSRSWLEEVFRVQ